MSTIKKRIKSTFFGQMLIYKIHEIQGFIIPRLVSDEKAVMKYYKKKTGLIFNPDNPRSFCEKLNWYKLFVHDTLMTQCADKVGIRAYVTKHGYSDSLNEIYGVFDRVEDIELDTLPSSFVIKAAHGTHMQIIVKNKDQVNWRQAKIIMKSWLKQDIYWWAREWVYKDMPHRLVIEKYLEDDSGELKDYKFFCFNGIPQFMQYDSGRFQGKQFRNYYNMNLELEPFKDGSLPQAKDCVVPVNRDCFNKMIEMATVLSKPFQFVRIDFYCVNEKIYIGEMTFYDGGGFSNFYPPEYDVTIGNYWTLSLDVNEDNGCMK